MPRVRCHYDSCAHLEVGFCSADLVELDPEMGCLAFAQEAEDLADDDEWDEELFEEEDEEEADWDDEEIDDELDEEDDLDEEW